MKLKILIPCIIILCFAVQLFAQDQIKRLYLGNDTHTDLMWNGDEEYWYDLSLKMAEFYLKLGEGSANNQPDRRSRWNYDVAWVLYMLEKRTSPEFFTRIIEQIKNGQASVPYSFTLQTYGGATAETILRGFYYGGYLERKYGIDIDLAICQENATIPLGLASLWAGSGAKYSWKGVCNCATKINTVGTRDHEIYWYTGLDGSKVLMKWYSSYGWNGQLGGYSEMLEPTVAVIQMDTLCGSKRYPYHIAGAFGKGWDNMINYSYDLLWGMGFRTRPGTKLFLSNQIDFFEDFEDSYGDILPEESLAYGNEWDLLPATLSEVTGSLKKSMEQLRTAEALATIVLRDNPTIFEDLKSLKEDFLYGLSVYYLHGWTVDGPIDRHDFATYMRQQQQKVSTYVNVLQSMAALKLGSMITKKTKEPTFYVFNPLNWARSEVVRIPINTGQNAVRDLLNDMLLLCDVVNVDGKDYLQFVANDIPSIGYKVYRLENSNKIFDNPEPFFFKDNTLETPFYFIKLTNSGVITSMVDKKSGKEWVKDYLNYIGSGDIDKGQQIEITKQRNSCISLECVSDEPIMHTSRFTFYRDDPRIDIDNTIHENFGTPLNWTYSFNVNNPEVWHEEVGAVVKAKRASEGGHYANKMARYDYLTLNHFMDVGNDHEGVTISNSDCLFFRLGNSTPEFLDENSSEVHILIGGQVDHDKGLGIKDQDGDSVFHQSFSIRPRFKEFDQLVAMRFSLEHQNPLFVGEVSEGGNLPHDQYSYFSTSDPNLVLWSLKPGEEEGIIARLWNMAGEYGVSKLTFTNKLAKATEATHVETDIQLIKVINKILPVEFRPYQLKTYHVWVE
ncbi:glycosyl hydrolase-related protein [Bacteroidota bacterium]